MAKKYKYIDKECLRAVNYKALHVLRYNRAVREDVINALPDDRLFPVTFSMLHEHKAGVPCEPHVRCVILTPPTEAGGRQQLILDMEMNIFDLLPEIEIPDQPEEPVAEPVA
jgi:hypothetical protein